MAGEYEDAAEILEPLTELGEGEMAEDPDALYHMAQIELWRARQADDAAEAQGLAPPSERAHTERRRTIARRSTNVMGDALKSFGADVAPGAAAERDAGGAANFAFDGDRWGNFAAARNAQKKFRGLLDRAAGDGASSPRGGPPEPSPGIQAAEAYLERAAQAIEDHDTMDSHEETLKKIHLEQMVLAMEADDTRTARQLAEAGDIDLEPECRLVLAELLLKSGREKGAARQTVLAVQGNNANRQTMRKTISKRGTHMNVSRKSVLSHARGLRAAMADMDDDDVELDLGWAFNKDLDKPPGTPQTPPSDPLFGGL